MTKQEKMQAFIADLKSVATKHGVIVDKYSNKEKGESRYFFKIQAEDIEADIEDIFSVVKHG